MTVVQPGAPIRCQWVTDVNPDTEEKVLVFVPGCSTMLFDPENEQCCCDTYAHRLAVQVQQRRDCDREITALRRTIRAWSSASAAAYAELTGREARGYIGPDDLARAARREATA